MTSLSVHDGLGRGRRVASGMDESGRIGTTARRARRRRGMSLNTAAGLAGISKGYLSKLETGNASFTRRGLVEDLASALGCSPIDLTGLPDVTPEFTPACGRRVA